MKILILKIFVLCINILYAFMKLRKTQNKILYLSRQSDEKSPDMLMLESEIKKVSPETQQVFRLKRLKDESAISLSYILSIFGDMWEMASAKVVITDTGIVMPITILVLKLPKNKSRISTASIAPTTALCATEPTAFSM